MRALTIGEASHDLARWLDQAIAGEEIGIQAGSAVVALRPLLETSDGPRSEPISAREALCRLQQDARLSAAEAESYLAKVRAERLAENRGEP